MGWIGPGGAGVYLISVIRGTDRKKCGIRWTIEVTMRVEEIRVEVG